MRLLNIMICMAMVMAISCTKEIDLAPLVFDVTADSASYKAGSTASFSITGNPDHITFYSGELGSRYEFKDRVTADGVPQLRFSSARNTGTPNNSIALLVSSDFAGGVNASLDTAAIRAATWTDISTRVTWASGTTAVASGAIDLSDFANAGKPLYIAFKYKSDIGQLQNKWTITGLSLRNLLGDGSSYTIDTLPTIASVTNYGNVSNLPGWGSKTVTNNINWSLTATNMVFTGPTTAAAAATPSEAWAISGPINLKTVTPDLGTAVKNMAERVNLFRYAYAKAGTYNATFVVSNINVDQQQSQRKNITISVN